MPKFGSNFLKKYFNVAPFLFAKGRKMKEKRHLSVDQFLSGRRIRPADRPMIRFSKTDKRQSYRKTVFGHGVTERQDLGV